MVNPSIEMSTGLGDLPRVQLRTRDGALAEIYLHGAHVTRWVPAGGEDELFLSPTAQFTTQSSIRGGIPVIFPQFAERGPFVRHGFARCMDWEIASTHQTNLEVSAEFLLHATEQTRQDWPFNFEARLKVTLLNASLDVQLSIFNVDVTALDFTAALHTYLQVADVEKADLYGLTGHKFEETLAERVEGTQSEEPLYFKGPIDRIYYQAPKSLLVREPLRSTRVEMRGFEDVVVWNPWGEISRGLADMQPQNYLHMLCVEAAAIGHPIHLQPDQTWSGGQTLTHLLD